MATVGDILLTPEEGWQRIDDTNTMIGKIGSHTSYTSHTNSYNNTFDYTVTGSFKFKFYGTKLRAIGFQAVSTNTNYDPNGEIIIDDVSYLYTNMSSNTVDKNQVIIFEILNLPLGIHSVEIKSNGTQRVLLDAIDIDDTGYLTRNIGEVLSSCDTGFQRIDDRNSNIYYENVSFYAHENHYKGTYSYFQKGDNDYIKFSFVGSRFRLIGVISKDYASKIEVKIDGNIIEYASCQNLSLSDTQLNMLFYAKDGLDFGFHTVELKNISKDGIWGIDAIDINSTGSITSNYDDVYSCKSAFEGCTSLTTDVLFTNNIQNCTSAYKNCTNLASVHSNWNNSYKYTIVPTDCYNGCSKVSLIDNLEGYIYSIPKSWGGYGLVGVPTSTDITTLCNDLTADEIVKVFNVLGEITLPNLKTARLSFSVSSYNNKLYFIGGFTQNNVEFTTNSFQCYNLGTKLWETVAQPPKGIGSGNCASICTSDGNIYSIGGSYYQSGYYYNNTIYKYNIETNTWSQVLTLSNDVYKGSIFIINNKLYYQGVINPSSANDETKQLLIYDIATSSISYTDITTRKYPIMVAVGTDIYTLSATLCECIDTTTNTITTKTSSPIQVSRGACVGYYKDDKIYVLKLDEGKNYIYDISKDTWSLSDKTLPTIKRSNFGSVIIDNKVYIAGGYLNSNSSVAINTIERYDIDKDVWEISASPTLTIGSTNIAKLSAEQIAIATSKGWTLA